MRTLMIQGTSSGAGKSTVVTALCRIFSDMGVSVAPYKSQNMSNLSYRGRGFEISRAQAIQAVAARTPIVPELNPILLKPRGNYYSTVYTNGRRLGRMHARDYYSGFVLSDGIRIAAAALEKLQKSHDMVILEGAGSPAEINLQKYDIANMAMAQRARAPVVLVADIDRGGAFASLAGTMQLLGRRHQDRVRGFIFNKFRGDKGLLEPGIARLGRITKKETFGVLPMMRLDIPDEDSLDATPDDFSWDRRGMDRLDAQISKLARTVREHLDVGRLEAVL